jgi:PadR family transcriptional regulator PadR
MSVRTASLQGGLLTCSLRSIRCILTKYTNATGVRVNSPRLGEFEQLVLLSVLRLGEGAYAIGVRQEIEQHAGRSVTRGALYRTFDRLEAKGLVEWTAEPEGPAPERGGHPMRRFSVTEAGLEALHSSRTTLLSLWDGVEAVLDNR